jgi:hypothetical protein
VKDQDGNPVIDPATGKPQERVIDLQGIFRTAFVNAYGYYVNSYFSSKFYRNLDAGQL